AMGIRDDPLLREAIELSPDHLHCFVKPGIAEDQRVRIVSEQSRNAGAGFARRAECDDLAHSGCVKFFKLVSAQTHVCRSRDLALAHGNATRKLRDVLTEERRKYQPLEVVQPVFCLKMSRP